MKTKYEKQTNNIQLKPKKKNIKNTYTSQENK